MFLDHQVDLLDSDLPCYFLDLHSYRQVYMWTMKITLGGVSTCIDVCQMYIRCGLVFAHTWFIRIVPKSNSNFVLVDNDHKVDPHVLEETLSLAKALYLYMFSKKNPIIFVGIEIGDS